jgi:hypothetical protein
MLVCLFVVPVFESTLYLPFAALLIPRGAKALSLTCLAAKQWN